MALLAKQCCLIICIKLPIVFGLSWVHRDISVTQVTGIGSPNNVTLRNTTVFLYPFPSLNQVNATGSQTNNFC